MVTQAGGSWVGSDPRRPLVTIINEGGSKIRMFQEAKWCEIISLGLCERDCNGEITEENTDAINYMKK